jgi:hypothetical protein
MALPMHTFLFDRASGAAMDDLGNLFVGNRLCLPWIGFQFDMGSDFLLESPEKGCVEATSIQLFYRVYPP